MDLHDNAKLHTTIHEFLIQSFPQHKPADFEAYVSDSVWSALHRTGTRLWLDTGSLADASQLWTREFSALTTNNTLLNKEVQTGQYDRLIRRIDTLLAKFPSLTTQQRRLETAFILNAWHGLRLVEQFDAYVSVEEHTDLANDIEQTVETARRYYRICPERFIIKIPFTPAGVLATRLLSAEGVPVNHTLGFSARQNYLITRIAQPAYVNVFLDRLNSFITSNHLGDGRYIGEKATLASQAAIKQLRRTYDLNTNQIAASLRNAQQILDLAGVDIITMLPNAAVELLESQPEPAAIEDHSDRDYRISLAEGVNLKKIRLDTLWSIEPALIRALDHLENENVDAFAPDDLIEFFQYNDISDLLVHWNPEEVRLSRNEGKIPSIQNWDEALADHLIGLDTLMNLAGLNSFIADQAAMDHRVSEVLQKVKT